MKKLLAIIVCIVMCSVITTSTYAVCVPVEITDTYEREANIIEKLLGPLPVILTFDEIVGTQYGIDLMTSGEFSLPKVKGVNTDDYYYRYGVSEIIDERIDYYKDHPEETLHDAFDMNCIHYGNGVDSYDIHVTVDDIGLKKDYLIYSHCNGHI